MMPTRCDPIFGNTWVLKMKKSDQRFVAYLPISNLSCPDSRATANFSSRRIRLCASRPLFRPRVSSSNNLYSAPHRTHHHFTFLFNLHLFKSWCYLFTTTPSLLMCLRQGLLSTCAVQMRFHRLRDNWKRERDGCGQCLDRSGQAT